MKLYLFLLLFFCMPLVGRAQTYTHINLAFERIQSQQVAFYADNPSYAPYTVTLKFTRLSNASNFREGEEYSTVVGYGRKQITTLRPENVNSGIGFAYNYSWRKGDLDANPDTTFVYLFPLAKGKSVKMNKMISLGGFFGIKGKRKDLTGVTFQTTRGDTIVAARGGMVTEIRDDVEITDKTHKGYDATENFIEIYHEDGTFAVYKLFKKKGVFVRAGDHVIPGQPLGTIDGSDYGNGSHLRFSIFVPSMDYRSFMPCFHLSSEQSGKPTVGELYTSEHPVDIVTKEMSKKEKKKYLGK